MRGGEKQKACEPTWALACNESTVTKNGPSGATASAGRAHKTRVGIKKEKCFVKTAHQDREKSIASGRQAPRKHEQKNPTPPESIAAVSKGVVTEKTYDQKSLQSGRKGQLKGTRSLRKKNTPQIRAHEGDHLVQESGGSSKRGPLGKMKKASGQSRLNAFTATTAQRWNPPDLPATAEEELTSMWSKKRPSNARQGDQKARRASPDRSKGKTST